MLNTTADRQVRQSAKRPLRAGLVAGLTGVALVGTGSPVWAAALVQTGPATAQVAQPSTCAEFTQLSDTQRFLDEVPQPPLATPDSTAGGVDHYTLTAHVGEHSFSPANGWPKVTTLGYSAPGAPSDFLGPTIVTQEGRPANVTMINNLPAAGTQIFPFDQPNNDNMLTLHRHGGLQEAVSDGAPAPIGTEVPPGSSQTQVYPNNQAAAPLWYHDHVDAQTSYHAYEGLAGFIPNTDKRESSFGLPEGGFAKAYVLQDKSFDSATKELCYSHADPEFFGTLPVVNGVVAPKQEVEPRRYTFTFINGSDSRFYRLSLTQTSGPTAPAPTMTVVASDSGYLLHPAEVNELLVAPGERYKVVVDFTGHNTQNWVLANNAPIPFGALDEVDSTGGGIDQLMRFDVGASTNTPDKSRVPGALPDTNNQTPPAALVAGARLRTVQAAEVNGAPQLGDKNQVLNYITPPCTITPPHFQPQCATETPQLGSTEAWAMRNHSPDAHPIHLHLVEMRLIGRWPAQFDANGTPTSVGAFQPPAPYETGPKETIVAPPNFITVWAVNFTVSGNSVWHCHIMSHEDGASTGGAIEMMRPLVVGDTPQTQLPLIQNQVELDELIRL